MNSNKWMIYLVTLVAALGGFLFGYDTGVIGGTQLYFTEYFGFTSGQQGFAVASAIYGCLAGALIAGYLTNAISRKYTLILSAVLFSISAWGSGVADSYLSLVVYRVIGGLGIGLASMAAPMLIAEISPAKDRGRMVSLYQLAIVIGFFVVFLATYLIGGGDTASMSADQLQALNTHNTEKGWRTMFWSELIPAGLFFILLFFIPHSPRWLMMKGRKKQARAVLNRINSDHAAVNVEIAEIEKSLAGGSTGFSISMFKGLGVVLIIGNPAFCFSAGYRY